MKRLAGLLPMLVFAAGLQAQTPEELLEQLKRANAALEELSVTISSQQRRIQKLERELESVREEFRRELDRPRGNHASAEDLRLLREKVEEIDKKRIADRELILKEIKNLVKDARPPTAPVREKPPETPLPPNTRVLPHKIVPGDTLDRISRNFNEYLETQGIKKRVTVDLILKANPGLDANRLIPGKEILLPVPE